MSQTTKLLTLVGVVVACGFGVMVLRVARATPPQGVTSTLVAGPVTLDDIDARVLTPDYKSRVKTKGASDSYVVINTIAPGGGTGWHSHAGIVFVMVQSGSATTIDENFVSTVYPAGTGFVEEPGHVHIVVNQGTTNLELVAFFLLPKGAPLRIDEPAP